MPRRDFDSWMWDRAVDLLDHAERLHRQIFQPVTSAAWQPPIDLFETDDALWLIVALPGVDPSGLEIFLENGQLVVRGARSLPEFCQRATVHRMELPRGRFERSLDLPPGEYELGERRFTLGCLIFSLKKMKSP